MAFQKTVIANKYLPTKLPLFHMLLAFLMLDYYNAPGWVWGVVGTIYAILWPITIYALIKQNQVTPQEVKEDA